MNLHTLGPANTDSARAARHYLTDQSLVLHDSFEAILQHLRAYRGDELLMPVAFTSREQPDLNWADFNYVSADKVHLKASFVLPLMPLILVENTAYQRDEAVIHAATEGLLRQYLASEVGEIEFVASKPVAQAVFLARQSRYTIVSADTFTSVDARYVVRRRFEPQMIWAVYDIL
ncbi:MAG TPA: hypothetical protein VGM95_07085 [Lactobacillaceae bacterium]|jgi:hypothetical protein